MLVLSGYVDLSVGSVAVLGVAVFGSLAKVHHQSILVAVIGAILVGAAWGLMNGVLIAYLGFSPIIVTLGGFAAARGLAEAITHDVTRFGFGDGFGELGNGEWFSIPIPAVIFLGAFLIGSYIWYEMPAGRHLTAIGADRTSARALGVSPARLPCAAYVASGAAAAVGGLILTSELDGASLSIGVGLELQVLTAILLGGVAFAGGRGSLWGVLFGVFFVGVLNNGLILHEHRPVRRQPGRRHRARPRRGAPTASTSASSACRSRSRNRPPGKWRPTHRCRARASRCRTHPPPQRARSGPSCSRSRA